MPVSNVVDAVWGWMILNTIILNRKENGAKLSSCASKPPSASPERVAPARRSVLAFRAVHKPPIISWGFHPQAPDRRARRGGFFWCVLFVVSMRIGQEPLRLFCACCRGVWCLYKNPKYH